MPKGFSAIGTTASTSIHKLLLLLSSAALFCVRSPNSSFTQALPTMRPYTPYTHLRHFPLFTTNRPSTVRRIQRGRKTIFQLHNNSKLYQLLEELATFNKGKSVNPRSYKQVSQLLYRDTQGVGGTDRNTLLSIVNRVSEEHDGVDEMEMRQKRIASLILECREIMMMNDSNKINYGKGMNGRSNSFLQAASFSNMASNDINGDDQDSLDKDSCTGTQRQVDMLDSQPTSLDSEQTDNTLDDDSSDIVSLPPTTQIEPALSPYDQMVYNLFSLNGSENDNTTSATSTSSEATSSTSSLDPYWIEPLLSLTKSSSRSLVKQLNSNCPLGFDPNATPNHLSPSSSTINKNTPRKKETPHLSFVRSQKLHFSDTILLLRVGDFYETYGIDAILLVEYAGLNPMAGKARAGCPWRNIQATLDALTGSGFRVAVYEEWNGEEGVLSEEMEEDSSNKGKLKTRYLTQVVSSAQPTYMHGMVLNDNDGSALDESSVSSDGSRDDGSFSGLGRSYVGVIETRAGYTLVEISAEERTAVVSERLTAEAVACRLIAYPPADPLFYVPPSEELLNGRRADRLPFLPWRQQQRNQQSSVILSPVSRVRVKTIPPSLVVEPAPGLTDLERAKQTIVSAFLRLEDDSVGKSINNDDGTSPSKRRERRRVSHRDFALITPNNIVDDSVGIDYEGKKTAPLPLHLETATQLGLMGDSAIPSLVASLLPDSAPSSCRRFLRRWLLVRPPPDVADAMSKLVQALKEENRALPNAPPLTAKVIPMIRAGQASATVYRSILSALDAAIQLLDQDSGSNYSDIISPLVRILQHDTGMGIVDSSSLKEDFLITKSMIEAVVSTQGESSSIDEDTEEISYFGDVIPFAFFERNEATWRGRVKKSALKDVHWKVAHASMQLAEAVATDFWGVDSIQYNDNGELDLSTSKLGKSPILQDIFNNIIAINKSTVSEWIESNGKANPKYYHPRDRNGKPINLRYTTERVEHALLEYVEACDNAKEEVTKALMRLSYNLADNNHLPIILQASHLNLIATTAIHHAASSNAKGWGLGIIYDESGGDSAGFMNGLWPYWMDKTCSVPNTFDLNGMFLLTAPNMSGKSTLMRSTAAAVLLISCGLCAPIIKGSSIRRFDSLFVRGASADIPSENKSAFGAEMGDCSSLLRACGTQSLVFVDEIGRGTSPKDGTSLAGAILERMAEDGMSGMFATHLHGILNFPLSNIANKRLRKKRMAIEEDEAGHLNWTYKMEDGVCTNSLALLTASKFGLPKSIIARAEELSKNWDSNDDTPALYSYEHVGEETTNGEVFPTNVSRLLENTASDADAKSIFIPRGFMPPPSLEGSSCVYIVQIGEEFGSMKYYIGETDSLARRLLEHRSKGDEWATSSTIAIQVEGGKSSARSLESTMIQLLAKMGFDIMNRHR